MPKTVRHRNLTITFTMPELLALRSALNHQHLHIPRLNAAQRKIEDLINARAQRDALNQVRVP